MVTSGNFYNHPYKATNFKFNIMELNNKIADVIIKEITQLIENVENENQKNDQWFLKFLDDLNSLSVKY